MHPSTSSQRGASRSGRNSSSVTGKGSGGSSARTRKGATASSSPRKPRTTAKRRSSTGAAGGARRKPSRSAPRRGTSALTPVLVVASIILLAWMIYPALKIQYQTSRRVAGLQAKYDTLKERNATLKAEVADLKKPEGVEKAARETLGLTRPGENVYVVLPASAASGQPAVAQTQGTQDAPDVVTALLDAVFGVRK
jgi:cell division protein FtsL